MAASRRVVEQHEDWLNLADAEAPWFSLPALKRALPNGLDPTPPEVRAEHRARWYGDDDAASARLADDRSSYIGWLLADVLGWDGDYVTGPAMPVGLVEGVTRYDVTIVPSGVYQPTAAAPVGVSDGLPAATGSGIRSVDGPRVLVFCLPAGTDPRARPAGDSWSATWVQRAALSCRYHRVPLALVTDGDHLTLVHAPRTERYRLGHMAGVGVRDRACAVGLVPFHTARAAVCRCSRPGHTRSVAGRVGCCSA